MIDLEIQVEYDGVTFVFLSREKELARCHIDQEDGVEGYERLAETFGNLGLFGKIQTVEVC